MYTGLCICMCINRINVFVYLCVFVREHLCCIRVWSCHFHCFVRQACMGVSIKATHAFTNIYLTDFLPSLFTVRRLLQTHSKVLVQMVRCIIMPGKCEQLLFIAEQMLTAWKWYIANGMVDCLFSLMTVETSAGQGIYAGETWYKITLPEIRD